MAPIYQQKPSIATYINLIKFTSIVYCAIVTMLGTCLVYRQGGVFNWTLLPPTLVTMVSLNVASSLVVSYFDYIKGAYAPDTYDGSLVDGTLTTKDVRHLISASYTLSVFGVLTLVLLTPGDLVELVGLYLSLVLVGFNHAGGIGFKYVGVGHAANFLTKDFGVVLFVWISHGGVLSLTPLLHSIPMACLTMAANHADDTRDMVTDARTGVRTLAVVVGGKWIDVIFTVCLGVPFAVVSAEVFFCSIWFALPLLAMIPAVGCWRDFQNRQLRTLSAQLFRKVHLPFIVLYIQACVMTASL